MIEDNTAQSELIYSGLTKSGDTITGGITLQIVNDDPLLESCDIVIAVFEKGDNMLVSLNVAEELLNMGTNIIELNDLSFLVNPAIIYEVRIFCWNSIDTLMPITDVFKKDI